MLVRSRSPMRPFEVPDLAEMLAATMDAGFAIDAEGQIVLWNPAAESLLGYPAREVVGRQCCDLLLGDDDSGNRLCCRDCHATDPRKARAPVQSVDMRVVTKAGATIWVNVSTLRVSRDESGDRTVHLLRDVTATREILALIRERLAIPAMVMPTGPNGRCALTRREVEILNLISTGLSTKDAAERLAVSPATVRNHVQNILGKLGAHSRLEAVAYATRRRLI